MRQGTLPLARQMLQIFDAEDPMVRNGTYDIFGWRPGEEQRVRKAKERMTHEPITAKQNGRKKA